MMYPLIYLLSPCYIRSFHVTNLCETERETVFARANIVPTKFPLGNTNNKQRTS